MRELGLALMMAGILLLALQRLDVHFFLTRPLGQLEGAANAVIALAGAVLLVIGFLRAKGLLGEPMPEEEEEEEEEFAEEAETEEQQETDPQEAQSEDASGADLTEDDEHRE